MRILLLNGPNLGRLGLRQPEIYGTTTLAEVEQAAAEHAVALGHTLVAFQSNHEGALIDRIEQRDHDAIVINPGALTHTSYALHDALIGAECPSVEIHISDILSREAWRRVSVIEPVVSHRIMGHGWRGYLEAIDFLHELAARTARPEDTRGPAMTALLPRPGLHGVAAVEMSADTISPVTAALRLRDRLAFILESVEGGARYGRYSMVGVRGRILSLEGGVASVLDRDYAGVDRFDANDPLEALRRLLPAARDGELPVSLASGVGYLAYEAAARWERLPVPERTPSVSLRRSSTCPRSSSSSTTWPRRPRWPPSMDPARRSDWRTRPTGWPSPAPTRPPRSSPVIRCDPRRLPPTCATRPAWPVSSATSGPARCCRPCWRAASRCPAPSGPWRSTARFGASTPRRISSRLTWDPAARCWAPHRSSSCAYGTASSRRGPSPARDHARPTPSVTRSWRRTSSRMPRSSPSTPCSWTSPATTSAGWRRRAA